MRKALVLVFLLVLIIACVEKKPPAPPEPPEPPAGEVCGNGVCGQGETAQNCPADCKVIPPPEPPEIPQQKRDHSVFRSVGFYGLLSQPNIDLESFFRELPKGITAVSVFGLSGWLNYGFYPWPVKGNGYDLTKLNPQYFAKVDKLFYLAARYDVIVEWCFDTKYLAGKHWSRYPAYGRAETPYCFPGAEVWCDMNSTRLLYENWNRKDPTNCNNFSWLCWKTGANDVVLSATGTGKLGMAKVMYGRAIADAAKRAYGKNKNFKIYIRPFNEEDNDWQEDHRIENWYDMEFRARGFKVGANYRVIENTSVWVGTPRQLDIAAMRANLNWLKARNRWIEIHNCDSALAQKLIAAGFDMNATICSTDAIDDDLIDTEVRKLLAMRIPKLDIKPSDRWIKAFNKKNHNANITDQMPELKAIFR